MRLPTDKEARDILRECFSRDSYIENYMQQKHIMLMIKQPLPDDRVLWCNDVVCEKVGQPLEKIAGTNSSQFWPELAEKFHLDDLDVMTLGDDRLRYAETYDLQGTAPVLLTSKFNILWLGEPALMVVAVDAQTFVQGIQNKARTGDTGHAYQFGGATNLVQDFTSVLNRIDKVIGLHG